ncbi:hypothetical protein DHEL01_v209097 [Diaporthe helianthi]|uniref:Uncharacterized protein n=1 Tax=Diaporthe helianthi TaxID=158607 RepID=A0A2P5HQG2_DIAHE|nr:hypothetical protein DHEL01_v209097 [Diaporthe helianthi]
MEQISLPPALLMEQVNLSMAHQTLYIQLDPASHIQETYLTPISLSADMQDPRLAPVLSTSGLSFIMTTLSQDIRRIPPKLHNNHP